jgi:hypothetical protein
MPRISAFYGIVIWMYHDEAHHLGRPHFHARYGDDGGVGRDRRPGSHRRPAPSPERSGSSSNGHVRIKLSCMRTGTARRHQSLRPIDPLR